jgi:UDP-N-acetylmuramoylalanine--D-glutamate ligase
MWLEDGKLMLDGEIALEAADIPLRGRHNIENTMAAVVGAHLAGAPLDGIRAAVRTFPGVPHRLEFVRAVDGVDYYNDSKATNVDATMKAIDAFTGGLWIILGGKDKGSDYRPLRSPLRKKARAALLIGAAAAKIAEHLDDAAPFLPAGTIEEAVRIARSQAKPGDTVLLAPACASFDQFQNFEHRGQVFKDLVNAL